LLITLNTPAMIMPPIYAPQGDRTAALFRWAEGQGGCGLILLQDTVNKILENPVLDINKQIVSEYVTSTKNPIFNPSFYEDTLKAIVYGVEVIGKMKPTLNLISSVELELFIDGCSKDKRSIFFGEGQVNSYIRNKPIKLTANVGWWKTTYELEVDGITEYKTDQKC